MAEDTLPTKGHSQTFRSTPIDNRIGYSQYFQAASIDVNTGYSEHIEFASIDENVPYSEHAEFAPTQPNSSSGFMPEMDSHHPNNGHSQHFKFRPTSHDSLAPAMHGRERLGLGEASGSSEGTNSNTSTPPVNTPETPNPANWPSENEEDDEEDADYEDDDSEDDESEDDESEDGESEEEDDDDNAPSKETTIIPPAGPEHTHTFIFLHSREDYGSELSRSFFQSTSKSSPGSSLAALFPSMRFVFPTAPLLRSERHAEELSESSFDKQLEGEEVISQWFDLWDVAEPGMKKGLMREGLKASIGQIAEIVKEEAEIVGRDNVILGGISQGCATALVALLEGNLKVGAFVGWCGWLPFSREIRNFLFLEPESWEDTTQSISMHVRRVLERDSTDDEERQVSKAEEKATAFLIDTEDKYFATRFNSLSVGKDQRSTPTPMFFAHSEDDGTVPFKLGKEMNRAMNRLGFDARLKSYEDGGHWIHSDHGVDDMAGFLEPALGLKREV
ncbi:uncharacterized protein RSE6_13227 [Rhynchosporium secalis]|uniref:Phospholipase/carboxylesterase/thioesterase domain-containing protein n=1 Tax=Rhynchosporium secalis TaxID=38038 RepID=A0A1E1MT69_RHYSE|nr:uncharacterized protein RSE6_13227 [Rhynchosporium secalis]